MKDMIESIGDGDAIAVRAERDGQITVLSGRAEIDEDSPWEFAIDPRRIWSWPRDDPAAADGDDLSEDDLDFGPPEDVRRGLQDDYGTRPGVQAMDDGTHVLLIPGAVYNGNGLLYYAPDMYGAVDHVESGPLVDPHRLLPDETETVEAER